MNYYDLTYGTYDAWIATLGPHPEQVFDPQTGKEDFTEPRKVRAALESWKPGEPWTPQPICVQDMASGQKHYKADRIYHNVIGPMISQNAVDKMRPWLEKEGHLLPLHVANSTEKFFLWWVPLVMDSVDFDKCEMFPNGKRIKRYAFDQNKLNGIIAFRPHYHSMRVPELKGDVFVSDEFRQAWLDAKLTGIEFKPA